ncbi:MAG: biotin/lipoyl-containing protein [Anaerovoracaceae bacterium]
MEKKMTMPKLRPEMKEGILCAWLKDEGDVVTAGEPVYEIETDKVVNQVEAPVSGVLKKILAEEGDSIPVEDAVAILETEE